MRIQIDDSVSASDIEAVLRSVAAFLHEQRFDRLSDLSLSFHAWRGDNRCQLVDGHGRIHSVHMVSAAAPSGPRRYTAHFPIGTEVRVRSSDAEWSPWGLMLGHDD